MCHGVNISRLAIRGLLDRYIQTDADLDSFCMDYFPDVYREFSGGMERKRKLNLLLQNNERLPKIIALLTARFPGSNMWPTLLHLSESDSLAIIPNPVIPPRLLWILGLLTIGAMLLALGAHLGHGLPAPSIGTPTLPQTPVLLTSHPQRADVVFDHEVQGHTPYNLAQIPDHIDRLCLRARWHADQVIEIQRSPGQANPISRHVELRERDIVDGYAPTRPECKVDKD